MGHGPEAYSEEAELHGAEAMTSLLLALTLCLQVDGVQVGPIALTDPPIITATASGATVRLSRWDANRVASELRGRVTELQVRAWTFRLREPSTEALRCGECEAGGYVSRPTPACVPGKKASPCMTCKTCADPLPEPIACGAPPTGVRILR